jgi:nitrogen regulatory protein PII
MDRLERVERALQDIHVGGVTVSRVKGYGEYVAFFARGCSRLDVSVRAARDLHERP